MRYESSITSLSWIPSEAVTGPGGLAFNWDFGHYDDPPSAELGDLEELRAADNQSPNRAPGLDRGRRRRADQ